MSSPLHKSVPAAHPSNPESNPGCQFSPSERQFLLNVAHDAIGALVQGRKLKMEACSVRLAEPRGVFTTIYLQGELRGCVGYVFPVLPLVQAVAETAQAAASQDTRFRPVAAEEEPHLRVSLSVLSSLFPVAPDQIEIGRHGLVVTWSGHRGLLLPQVPIEHRWDRETFLEQTCRKAGLPPTAWKGGAKLEAFTAEVFGDEECPD